MYDYRAGVGYAVLFVVYVVEEAEHAACERRNISVRKQQLQARTYSSV